MLKIFKKNKKHFCRPPYPAKWYNNSEWKCYKCKTYWYKKYDKYGEYFVKRK